MAKLRELVSVCARALGDPEPSVNVLAMQLRKHGLIRSTGRGLNAAEMSARDATNLLTATLSGGNAIETARTTAYVLATSKTDVSIYPGSEEDYSLLTDQNMSDMLSNFSQLEAIRQLDVNHSFGEMLEAIIQNLIDCGHITWLGSKVDGIKVQVDFYGQEHSSCSVSFEIYDSDDKYYPSKFLHIRYQHDDTSARDAIQFMAFFTSQRASKHVSVSVNKPILEDIANCLRGRNIEEDHDDHTSLGKAEIQN
jgi:hypothetical protein